MRQGVLRARSARLRIGTGSVWAAALLALTLPAASAAGPRLPPSFFGIGASNDLLDGRLDLGPQLTSMRAIGTGTIRFPIYWGDAQPYASWSAVPARLRSRFVSAGGRPTTFVRTDRQILAFASHGLQMLPVLVTAPAWARVAKHRQWSPPANPVDYGRFAGALVQRYGVGGQFWALHPGLARMAPRWWQIWNEPAGGSTPDGPTIFWQGPEPYEPRYVAMLREARRALRAADPGAHVVLAGLFGRSWEALRRLYAFGAGGLFDAVAVHPYANTPAHVLTILRDVHAVMRRARQATLPLLVTETSWPSSLVTAAGSGVQTTEAGQAADLAQEYRLLVAHRRELNLRSLFWYTWIGVEPSFDPFEYSGLLRITPAGRIVKKPAFWAYRRELAQLEG